MSRKRKLYLTELLNRYHDKDVAVHFSNHYYDTVIECLQSLRDSETYYNAEVEEWLLTKYGYPQFNGKTKYVKVLVVKLK